MGAAGIAESVLELMVVESGFRTLHDCIRNDVFRVLHILVDLLRNDPKLRHGWPGLECSVNFLFS